MKISVPFMMNIMIWIFSADISLLFGLSMVGEKAMDIIERVSISALILYIFYYPLFLVFNSTYCVLLAFLLLIPIMKILLKRTYTSISIAVLLALILKTATEILINEFTFYLLTNTDAHKTMIYTFIMEFGVFLILGIIVLWKNIKLIPKDWEMCSIEDNNQKKQYNRNILLIMLVLVLAAVWLIYVDDSLKTYKFVQQIPMLSFTFIFLIICIYFIKILVSYGMERIEALIDKQYQKEVQAFMEVIRSQRHDFNFHLQAISGLLNNEHYMECKDYVNTMVKDANSMNDVLYLYHPATGAMLNAFRELAARKGIQLKILIYYNLENIPCTVYETNKILGNLIQNAIDEVEQHLNDSAWIEVMILKRSGNSVFRVSNKMYGDKERFANVFNLGYSTKSSHEGIGLNTVKKFAGKYDGTVYTEFEDDIIHFIVQIPNRYS